MEKSLESVRNTEKATELRWWEVSEEVATHDRENVEGEETVRKAVVELDFPS